MRFEDLYGAEREAAAALGCEDGRPVLWLAPRVSRETLAHELAHAVHCAEAGDLLGDFGPRADLEAWAPSASDYCAASPAERWACFATERPREALRWLRSAR